MKMSKLSDIFEILPGSGLSLNHLNKNGEIAFISRTAKNNGISGYVEQVNGSKVFESGLITVSLGGTVLEAFVQENEFYTGFHIAVLKPKKEMSMAIKMFYCLCIRKNKYKYNYGRQANRTLKDLDVPSLSDLPLWVNQSFPELSNISKLNEKLTSSELLLTQKPLILSDLVPLSDLFDIKQYSKIIINSQIQVDSGIPVISSTSTDNGITMYVENITNESLAPKNSISVAVNGSVLSTFLQEKPYYATGDIKTLVPKKPMTKIELLFYSLIITKNKYKYNYGRKANKTLGDILVPKKIPKNLTTLFSNFNN